MTKAFCDGFEVIIGDINKAEAAKGKLALINLIHSKVNDIAIKNILPKDRAGQTYLWITLSPETAILTSISMQQLTRIVKTIREFSSAFWAFTEEMTSLIQLTKIDVTMDLEGSFLPGYTLGNYQVIKDKL